jgi:integrase
MRLMTHLRKLTDGTYEVRITVPSDCRAAIGRANLTRRLGRITKVQANKLAAPVVIEFQARIEAVRVGAIPEAMQPSSEPAGLIDPRSAKLIFDRWRAMESERLRLLIFNGMDPEPPAPDMRADLDAWVSWRASKSRLRRCLSEEEWERVEHFDVRMLSALREGGLDVDADHPALGRLRPLFAAAWSAVLEAADDARSGDDAEELSVEIAPIVAATVQLPYAPLLELFEGYAAERKPVASTVKRWRPVMDNLVAHIGHDDASRFTPDDIVAWKTNLLSGRAAKTVREVYLAAVKAVLTWAVENRRLAGNVASGITVRAAKRPVTTRERGFNKAEAQAVLRAALDAERGRLSVEHWRARRWVPWLCAYTGARVGEIGQLRGCDVGEIEGVQIIRITPDAGTVKSGQARIVPLHQHLVEMDFLKVARAAGDGPIFYNPGRARGGSEGNPHSKKVGEKLAKWVRALGIDHPELQPNHGWRHLFKTRARMAGIEADARDAIQGHAPRTEGEGYGDWPISVLADAIGRLPRFVV